MASTYSPNLRIELIGTGDQAGTWGNTTNSTDQYVLESAITGYQQVTVTSTSQALTYVNGATTTASSNQAIFAFLSLVTSGVSAPFNIYAPPNPKSYVVYNNSSYATTIYNSTAIGNTIAAGLGVTIPAGATITIWSDGTNFRAADTQTTGNFTVNGNLTVTGNQTEIGNFYAAGVFRAFTSASFTGSISGTTLTVTAVASGVLFQGMSISGTGIAAATSTNLTDPLSTTNGSSTVTVTQTAHGFSSGTPVTISGAAAVGGISAANLNGTFTITIINSSSYSYTASASATSTVNLSGGAVIVSTPQTQISGYGTGTGGNGTYTVNVPQSAASTTITGAPAATASTPPTTDNSNNVATTAFVKSVAAQAGSFTYPNVGIPLSTGASWGTSYNSSNPIPVSSGGTGLATLTSGAVLVGNGTSAPTAISPSSANNVLASNGSVWSSTPFSTLLGTSAVTSFNGRTGPVTPSSTDYSSYYYPLSSNPSNYVTSSALSGYAQLTNSGTQTFAGSINAQAFQAQGAGNAGDQKVGVSYGSYSAGLSATSLQLGLSGKGALYDFSSGDVGFINGGYILSITHDNHVLTSGTEAYKNGSSTTWNILSDARIKKNVVPYTKGLAELNQIQIKNFEFNGLGNSQEGEKGIGVIADEIKKILPDCVRTRPVLLNPTDTEKVDLNSFDATELIYLLVTSVQELNAKVTALEEQILNLGVK
jgi:hypothetical protein